MTFWSVLSKVNLTLKEAGQPENAELFRVEAHSLYDRDCDEEDNLADLYDLVARYVEVQ